jgi:hypothetical protein
MPLNAEGEIQYIDTHNNGPAKNQAAIAPYVLSSS